MRQNEVIREKRRTFCIGRSPPSHVQPTPGLKPLTDLILLQRGKKEKKKEDADDNDDDNKKNSINRKKQQTVTAMMMTHAF